MYKDNSCMLLNKNIEFSTVCCHKKWFVPKIKEKKYFGKMEGKGILAVKLILSKFVDIFYR